MKTKSSNDTESQRKRRSGSIVMNLSKNRSKDISKKLKTNNKNLNGINMKLCRIKIKRENLQKLLKNQVNNTKNSPTNGQNKKKKRNSTEKIAKTAKIEDNQKPSTSRNQENNASKSYSRKRKKEDDKSSSSINSSYENEKIEKSINVNKKIVQKRNGKSLSLTARKFENKIFIRFPDIKNLNDKNKRLSGRTKQISDQSIIEQYGVKFTKCYIKVKRIKQCAPKPNICVKQNNSHSRSVTFGNVKVNYYSSSKRIITSESEEENNERISDTIGVTSTPTRINDNKESEEASKKSPLKKRKLLESDSDSDACIADLSIIANNSTQKNPLDVEHENVLVINELKRTHDNEKDSKENDNEENEVENLSGNEEIDKFTIHGRKSYKEKKSCTNNEIDKTDKDENDASIGGDSTNTSQPINTDEKNEQSCTNDEIDKTDKDENDASIGGDFTNTSQPINTDEKNEQSCTNDEIDKTDKDENDASIGGGDSTNTPKPVNIQEKDEDDDSYKSANNDIDNVEESVVEESAENHLKNDVADALLTDDEDDTNKQNEKKKITESSIVRNNDEDSDDSFFGLSKVNENKTVNTDDGIDLFDIVKNSDVSAEICSQKTNEKNKFEDHDDDNDISEEINTIDDNIDGSDSNRYSPTSKLLKSNSNPNLNQVEYDAKIITTVTATAAAATTTTTVFNNDNDNFCNDIDDEYIIGADTAENPTDLLNDIGSLQFPGTNSNNQDNTNEMNIEQTLNNDNVDNNKKDDKKLSKFTLNKLIKMFH